MRKFGSKSAAHRAEDKGFYIILILCLTVIGISGYVLFFSPSARPADRMAVDGVQTDVPRTAGEEFSAVDERYDVPVKEPETKPQPPAQPKPKVQTAAPAQPKPKVWVRPTSGEVLQPFSGDELVFHETFGDWRVHQGVDYEGGAGTRVYAIGDGRIETVTSDPIWATCITLRLADDRTAVYRGMSERVKVKAGASVKAGDMLGTVGESVPAEAENGPHLHFELLEGGVYVNPDKLLADGKAKKQQTAALQEGVSLDGINVEE